MHWEVDEWLWSCREGENYSPTSLLLPGASMVRFATTEVQMTCLHNHKNQHGNNHDNQVCVSAILFKVQICISYKYFSYTECLEKSWERNVMDFPHGSTFTLKWIQQKKRYFLFVFSPTLKGCFQFIFTCFDQAEKLTNTGKIVTFLVDIHKAERRLNDSRACCSYGKAQATNLETPTCHELQICSYALMYILLDVVVIRSKHGEAANNLK